MPLPALSHDEVEADELAPSHLSGADHRAAFKAAPVCGVRRASSLGPAVTLILEAIPDQPANQYLLRSVFLRLRGGGGDPAVQSAMQLAM